MNCFYKRAIEPMLFYRHPNAIIHYIHCQDYRKGIIQKNGSFYAAGYIKNLLSLFAEATDEEKIAFLQHTSSQRKLFKIINSLFLDLNSCWHSHFSVTYLGDLLELLAFEPHVEEAFYTSPGFIATCLENIVPTFSTNAAWRRVGENRLEVHNLVRAAAKRYPILELTIFPTQNPIRDCQESGYSAHM